MLVNRALLRYDKIREKYDNYKASNGGVKIDLNKNYRSRKEVLDNINLLFRHLMTEECGDACYINDHQMNYGNTTYDEMCMDSFCGSGTTGVEAVRFGRKFIGIDVSKEDLEISKKRLEKVAIDAKEY